MVEHLLLITFLALNNFYNCNFKTFKEIYDIENISSIHKEYLSLEKVLVDHLGIKEFLKERIFVTFFQLSRKLLSEI